MFLSSNKTPRQKMRFAMKNSSIGYSNKPLLNQNLQILNMIFGLFDNSSFFKNISIPVHKNTIECLLRCPKCNQHKKRIKSHFFKSCRSLYFHLHVVHQIDKYDYPTVEDSIKLLQIFSIMLKLKMVVTN